MSRSVKEIYEQRISSFTTELKNAQSRSSMLSTIRLLVFVLTLMLVVWGMTSKMPLLGFSALLLGSVTFVILVIIHEALSTKIIRLESLLAINKKCLDRVEDRWSRFTDRGDDFVDESHPFSSDLDIVGKASLYQNLTTAHTQRGRKRVVEKLIGAVPSFDEIERVQKAVGEMAPAIEFRHEFEAAAMTIEHENPQAVLDWLSAEDTHQFSSAAKIFYKVFPYLSFVMLLLGFFYFRTIALPALFYFVQILLFGLYAKKGLSLFAIFDKQKKALNTYAALIAKIEVEPWHSEYLKAQKKQLVNAQGVTASQAFMTMKGIIEKASLRYNPLVHFFVNCFTLWDIRCAIAALQWKRENQTAVHAWLDVIAEFETLSSLAQLSFDHPQWQMPTVHGGVAIHAVDIKHPLIPEAESVGNDITMNPESRVVIISGSNMSGKSTFLRTIATNMVLAYAGAPVAAQSFSCGIFDIITSLRNSDAVAKKMSTFYTELLRIKEMLDSIREGKQTFFLIDEIFNGTNSHDRIDGAFVVLRELHKANCLGMLSTHDLELCTLSNEEAFQFTNYHFREEYKENRLTFDYLMYDGPSTTRNAIALMDIVGIPTEGLNHECEVNVCAECGRPL